MSPHPLVEVDPAALTIAYLSTDPDVVTALGGSAAGRVAGVNRPPYPRITVSDPPGGGTNLRWNVRTPVQVEVLGDLDGSPGKAVLRRIAMTAVGALWNWPDSVFGAEEPVITYVEAPMPAWMPLSTGQPRYVSTLYLFVHPPTHR